MAFRFKNFRVCQEAKDYCKYCKDIADTQITDKDLAGQISRALNSIVLKIAEGSADSSDIKFARFLGISLRSVYEVVAGFDLAKTYEMIDDVLNTEIENRAETLVKQLSAFRSTLRIKKSLTF